MRAALLCSARYCRVVHGSTLQYSGIVSTHGVVPLDLGCVVRPTMAPIHDAAQAGDVERIASILESSPGVIDSPGPGLGFTALHSAVIRGRTEAVTLLVARGADVDRANLNFLSPLFSAVSNHRKYEIVRALVVEGNANVLRVGNNAQTVLEEATRHKCDDSILSLLREKLEKAERERDAKKAEAKRKRAEAAAKRKAEREANGGKAPPKKKGKKKKAAPKSVTPPEREEEDKEEDAKPPAKESNNTIEENEEASPAQGGREIRVGDGEVEAPEVKEDQPQHGEGGNPPSDGEEGDEEEANEDPTPFLEPDNREVIGATELLLVGGTTVFRKDSVPAEEPATEPDEATAAVLEAAGKLTRQLRSWSEDQPAFAFFVPPEEVSAGRDAMEEAGATEQARDKPEAGALLAHGLLGVKDDGDRMKVKIKEVASSRKTAWAPRYYRSEGRFHSRKMQKVKAATNALKAQTAKGSLAEVKFYTEDRAWYWPTVLLVGHCKKVEGGLFGIKFDCIDQEHLHHGQ